MKKRLNLNDLKVKSFIVGNDELNADTIKGGALPGGPNDQDKYGRTVKWFCGGDLPDGGETVLNICETVYYDC
ncbi:MAG: pinensin family lanthipeptide [Bacteroidota bacterium]